jgi:hypothetical protein
VTPALLQIWKDCYELAIPSQTLKNDDRLGQAIHLLQESANPKEDPQFVPIHVIKALESLVKDKDALEQALEGTSLVYTNAPPPVEDTPERRKFQQRMQRLRLQQEETKYVRLTNNLQNEIQDDITTKSMTYAASVGLNMIVAPLSFGCFMYFFAGGVFDYFLGEEFSARTMGGTDIKRVIVGVVSGVLMLFIEMMLFVIRTYEVEAHTAKKQKKKKPVQPFGVYSKKGDRRAMPADRTSQVLFGKKD